VSVSGDCDTEKMRRFKSDLWED